MGKKQDAINKRYFGKLEILGESTFRSDYVECLCNCGQICDINVYNIIDGKRDCCGWCKNPNILKARGIKRFNRLTVIGNGDRKGELKCLCDCGETKDIEVRRLLKGDAKTCSCGIGSYTKVDECIDNVYYCRLEVLGKASKNGYIICKCECGIIRDFNASSVSRGDTKSCGCYSSEFSSIRMKEKATMKVGDEFYSRLGDHFTVEHYQDCDNVTILFDNGGRSSASAGNIRKGEVRNPLRPSVCGVGFLGNGSYKSNHKAYTHWSHMLNRCYTDHYDDSYEEVFVHEDWHNYQTFAVWFEDNWVDNQDVALDKDILVKGNKLYSSKTCCLVPENLNNFTCDAKKIRGNNPVGVVERRYKGSTTYLAQIYKEGKHNFIGEYLTKEDAFYAYKTEKEEHAKYLADKYHKDGLISDEVKDALYRYNVDIND